MLKQKLKFINVKLTGVAVVLALFVMGMITQGFGVFAANCATVTDCQAQINNLSSQNSQAQANIAHLEAQAGSYQNTITALQQQIDALNVQISKNESQQAQTKAELAQEKQTLADSIRTMYLEGNVSPLEVLASSKSLSDYANKQQYRYAVSINVKNSVDKISALENQLAQLHASLVSQQAQAAAAQAEQSRLLSFNEAQQNNFNSEISSNKAAINQLKAKIVALNTPVGSSFKVFGSCGGTYPSAAGPGLSGGYWGCSYYQDNTLDNWGMYNRECVSYTAWMVHEEYEQGLVAHDMPNWGGVGNAYQWIGDAESAGVPVDHNPQAGDIAIRPASGLYGDVGHAMYVAAVSGGSIYVQQYNADLAGHYSEGWRSASGLYFLHFSQW